jgi:xanthine dehydrogenase YagR molybdenum-binding subunit
MSTHEPLKPPAAASSFRPSTSGAGFEPVVGKPLPRVDGPLKVEGRATFAAEVQAPNLTYAALHYSSIARGRISSIDLAAARAASGVIHIMTHENAPRLKVPLLFPKGAAGSTLPVMQDPEIHWNGQPVAIVVAETQEQADHAAALIRVTYEEGAADVSFKEAPAKSPKDILGEPTRLTIGDAEKSLAAAPIRVDQTYRTPRNSHSAIELHAVTVVWKGDELTVHDSSQMVHLTQLTFAEVFEMPVEKVRVLSPFVGGGFGGKSLWNHHVLAAAVAKVISRPVRMVVSREGVFRQTGGRTTTEQRVALGARTDGTLTALIHTGVAAMTRHNNCPEQFTFPARHLYAADTFLLEQKIVELNMVPNTFMRAPGESVGTFALESALDELADALRIDPVELRRRIEPTQDPTSGHPFSERSLVEAYRRGARRFDWDQRRPLPRSRREGDWLIGYGVATATYPYYRMPGGAARIRLSEEGRAIVEMGSHEMGMGTATVQAQFAADLLGLPVNRVVFNYGDSSLATGTVAGGSSQSASIIAAVCAASQKLFGELLEVAGARSPLAGLHAPDVKGHHAGLVDQNDPAHWESYAALLKRAGKKELVCEAPAPEPGESQKYSMNSYGAHFCEVRVNAITGEVRIARWLASFDTGRILNPRTAASQFRGGIVMGIGLALSEEVLFDERNGRIMNPSMAEYHVPVHLDVPEIDVIFNDIPDPQSPGGVRGIGEIGITGVAAAIANAVYNATGKRVRELPITLDKLM